MTDAFIETIERAKRIMAARHPEGHRAWFHDIENLTKDHDGFVYWRGVEVEHFAPTLKLEVECVEAERIGAICRRLEDVGAPVTTRGVIRYQLDRDETLLASQEQA